MSKYCLLPLAGYYLVTHVCFRLAIITQQTEGEMKTYFLDLFNYILFSLYSLRLHPLQSFLCEPFFSVSAFFNPIYP